MSTPQHLSASLFRERDIKDSQSLAEKLQNNNDPLCQYIMGRLQASTRSLIGLSVPLKHILVDELNALLADPVLFHESRFKQVELTEEIQRLIQSAPEGQELNRLNRYLLAQAFPKEIGGDGHLNLGVIFITFFKWLLILLFALIVQRSAEGITFRLENKIVYSNHVVHSPILGLSDDILDPLKIAVVPHWSYLVGMLQMIITLLFAARYFLCLLDPLERISGIHSEQVELSDSNLIKEALFNAKEWHILLIIVIAVPEFLLLFHAATSFASYHQWICFLLLLVIWDSVLFFVVVGNLHYAMRIRSWLHRLRYRISHKRRNRRYTARLAHTSLRVSATRETLNQLQRERREKYAKYKDRRNRYKAIIGKLQNIRRDYGPWNYLDWLILFVCLFDKRLDTDHAMLLITSGSSWAELAATIAFAILFVSITIWFFVRFIIRNEMDSRGRFLGAISLVVFSGIITYVDSKMAWSGDSSASEFFILGILSAALIVFSFINYKTQPKLWQRHLAVLSIKA